MLSEATTNSATKLPTASSNYQLPFNQLQRQTTVTQQPTIDSSKQQTSTTSSDINKQQQQTKPNFPKREIVLNSPVGGKPAIFNYTPANSDDIIETIRWVSREYQEFKPAIDNLLVDHDVSMYEDVKDFCDRYNKITGYVNKMNKGTSIALKTSSRASQGLLKHIMHQVYNYAVVEPEKLNQYAPFSSEVYGETSFEFVAQMIDDTRTRPREKDTFIDLGSGVGQVVLQVAASVDCKKCYGIEKSEVPAKFAQVMEEKFRFWMDWFGKTYTEFEIFHGDFFEEKYTDIIRESTHLFINNFAFKPEVDHKLKLKFIDLKDGTRIISSKQFCPPRSRVTERDLSDIGSIMHVIEIQPEQKKDTVSWTDKQVPYFLHTLDGTRVEKYYERQKERSENKQSEQDGKRKRSSVSPPNKEGAENKTIPSKSKSKSKAAFGRKVSEKTNNKKNQKKTVEIENKTENNNNDLKKEKKKVEVKSVLKPKKRRRSKSASTDTEICPVDQLLLKQQVKLLVPTENTQPNSSSGPKAKRRSKSVATIVASSLDLLHEKTIESNTMDFSQPAPGCVDHSLNNTSNLSLLPNIIINDLSMFLATRNMDKLFDGLRLEFDKFVEAIKKPNMREDLLREIQRERDRKRELMFAQDSLMRHIKTLVDRANLATSSHCDVLGIPNNSKGLISHLGALLNINQELSKQISQLSTYPVLATRQQQQSSHPPLTMISPHIGHQPRVSQSIQMNPPAAHSQNKIPATGYRFSINSGIGPSQLSLVQTVPTERLTPHIQMTPSPVLLSSSSSLSHNNQQQHSPNLYQQPTPINRNSSLTLDLSKKTRA